MNIILKFVLLLSLNLINICSQVRVNQIKNVDKDVVLINSLTRKKQSNCRSLKCEKIDSSFNFRQLLLKRNVFLAGVDVDGQPLSVCRVNQFNELIPGKFSPSINKCMITYNKKEYQYNRYELLIKSKFGQYNWTQVKRPAKTLPDNKVVGGTDLSGRFYYISQCRVRSQNIKFISEQIGKVQWNQYIREWIATVPFSGQEIECFDYSILIMV